MRTLKAVVIMLVLALSSPSYALNIIERMIYKEVRLGGDKVLVNKVTGKVEKKLVDNKYEPIPSEQGWGGIPSQQDMYQARYDKTR